MIVAAVAGGLAGALPVLDDGGPLRVVFVAGTGAAGGGLIAATLCAICWTILSLEVR